MAAISVVYDDREWLQAYVGLAQRTFPLESSLCRHVVDAGEPLVVHDASVHAALAQMSVVQAGLVRGYAGAPVVTAAGDIRGTLCLFDSRPLDISAAELDTLVTLARRVAGELALRAERERVVRAADLRDAIVAALDVGIVVTDGARRVTHANQAFAAFIGLSPRDLVERDRDAVVELLAERSDHPDAVREAMRVHRQGPFLAGADLVLARPEARILRWSAKPLAAAGDGAQLETWSDVTAQVALERARERDAITDVLTGLHNRRAGEQALLAEIARARRSHSPLSLLYVDVDHFKRHNDEHGHAFGDAVLRVVAAALRENARVSDVVCRWGGEEFVVALPGETVDGALVCAERMRAAVEAQSSLARAAVTVSIGAAELGAGDDLEHLLAAADDALYAAKHGGRNRVRAHTPRRLLSQLR
jgi:diguanylate cyclase (GGDEF)-like protein